MPAEIFQASREGQGEVYQGGCSVSTLLFAKIVLCFVWCLHAGKLFFLHSMLNLLLLVQVQQQN